MKITALGTGSAFCMDNHQSNFLISKDEKNLLVDCGGDIRHSLRKVGLTYKNIDGVYVSHAHADHTGGLEWLGFCTFFDPSIKEKPKLFAERQFARQLWNETLKGGMEGLEGIEARLDTYFDVNPVEQNSYFTWQDIKFDIVQAVHVSCKYSIVNSFGLMFTDTSLVYPLPEHPFGPGPGLVKRIYLTTDVQFCPETAIKAYYNEADIIIQDCETVPFKTGVHANYIDLKTLSDAVKARMCLYHYQDNIVNEFDDWQKKAKDDGFMGFLKPGVVYEDGEVIIHT